QATKTIIDREYEELTEAETKDESVNIDLEKTNDIKSNEVENIENVNTELTDNNSFETLQNGSNNYKNINHELISIGFNVLQTTNIDSNIVQTDELETSKKLEETLMEFNIEARVNHVARGPVITRYEVLLAPGIKVSRIVSLQDNIALSLAASKIRVVAPIPGKSAVGIEIPNKHRTSVTLGDLLNCSEYKKHNYHLPIALGKGISGRTIIADLVTMPHLLIAGATGSGKSVFVNTLICSLLYSKTPSEARFIMIDPKRVELKMYNEIPNLIAPVITEPKKAVASLKWTVKEMERRYKLLERYNCRDIRSFNNKISLMKSKDPHYLVDLPLEYLIVIIDEFADLMMVCGKDAEEQVSRLAAMSRAVGIHLVVATQRPSVDVITGIIKANFPARIAFQVSSKTESRIILDTNGAEKLLGKGDLLFSSPGLGNPIRIQGAFLSDDEVSDITGHLKSISPPSYIDELESIETSDGDQSNYTIADEPLFREAVEIVLADRKVSASYLQRKMRIGYNRAARIVELMEEEGIITPANGSKPREILIENYQF
ncbi:MAG: DNA translocase FtsK, partial [Spirochaetota bacterium]|nr:DNA translocase FtsK [Spirochaetota bacterium]